MWVCHTLPQAHMESFHGIWCVWKIKRTHWSFIVTNCDSSETFCSKLVRLRAQTLCLVIFQMAVAWRSREEKKMKQRWKNKRNKSSMTLKWLGSSSWTTLQNARCRHGEICQGLVRFCPTCGDENISGTGTSLVIPVHASQKHQKHQKHITVEHVDSKWLKDSHLTQGCPRSHGFRLRWRSPADSPSCLQWRTTTLWWACLGLC